jgi:hypothetical protein
VPKRGEQVLQLGLDLLVAHLDGVDSQLETVELGELELGAHVDLDRDLEVAGEVLELGKASDVGFRTTEGTKALLFCGLAVEPVEAFVDGVVEHLGATDALVDDGRRHLALAEAWDVDLLSDVLVGVIDAGLEVFWADRDDELDARLVQLLHGGLHVLHSPVVRCRRVASWECVGATGFEPATSRSQTERSTNLSYAP